MKQTTTKYTIEEAKEKKGKLGMSDEDFENLVTGKQDDLFSDLRSLIFVWKEQKEGDKKLTSRLPNGKIVFLDRSDVPEETKINVPYICAVYERDREAFAKIICEEYRPIIYVLPSHLVNFVYKDQKGKTQVTMPGPQYKSYAEKIMFCVNESEKLGFPEISIRFRGNETNKDVE
jgi:hypothetical protein